MYAIKIYDITNDWSRDISFIGYYTGLYNASRADSGKFIGANIIREPENGYNIQLFKTKQAAEHKITKLLEVQEMNLHLSHMKFEIVELSEEDIDIIQKAKDSRKSNSKREVIYTGVSANYLKQCLYIVNKEIDNSMYTNSNYWKAIGKKELLEEILKELTIKED